MADEDRESPLALFKNPEFVALSGTAFARSQAYSTVLIALALYANVFGTTGFVEGLFGAAFAFVQLLIVLPLGRKVDTGNAKRYLLAGLLLNVLVFVAFVFVQNAIHVVLVRILQGIGASILWITGASVVGEISPGGERGRWLGTYNQVAAFSSMAGDLVGGYLLYAYDFTFTYAVLSAVTITATVLVLLFLRDNPGGMTDPEDATGRETLVALLGRPMVRALVTFRLAFSFGKMAVILFLPIYAKTGFGISSVAIGGILAGGKLAKGVLQGYMGDLTDRLGGEHRFVVVGALLFAVGTLVLPLAGLANARVHSVAVPAYGTITDFGAIAVMFTGYAIIGVADSIRLPASMSLFVTEGEQFDSVASSMSLRSISWKVGQIIGPLSVGVVKDATSMAVAFGMAAGFILLATGAFVFMYVRGTPADKPTGAVAND